MDITYMWNLKNDTNELTYKTETDLTDIENKFMVTQRGNVGAYIRSSGLTVTHH